MSNNGKWCVCIREKKKTIRKSDWWITSGDIMPHEQRTTISQRKGHSSIVCAQRKECFMSGAYLLSVISYFRRERGMLPQSNGKFQILIKSNWKKREQKWPFELKWRVLMTSSLSMVIRRSYDFDIRQIIHLLNANLETRTNADKPFRKTFRFQLLV